MYFGNNILGDIMCEEKENKQENGCEESNSSFETGSITVESSGHFIHCLTIIGQIEGHYILPSREESVIWQTLLRDKA